MQVSTQADLIAAVRSGAAEIVVSDPRLCRKVRLWSALRTVANLLVVVVLAVAIFIWANPLNLSEFKAGWMLNLRRIILAFGVLLLFADYVIPVVRLYKIVGRDGNGLRLVPRKPTS